MEDEKNVKNKQDSVALGCPLFPVIFILIVVIIIMIAPGKDDDTELYDVYTANDDQIAFLYILGTDGERKIGYLIELVKENDVWKFNYMEKCSISGGKRDY